MEVKLDALHTLDWLREKGRQNGGQSSYHSIEASYSLELFVFSLSAADTEMFPFLSVYFRKSVGGGGGG